MSVLICEYVFLCLCGHVHVNECVYVGRRKGLGGY